MPPKINNIIPADLKVVDLRKELSTRGLPTKGVKKELVARLEKALLDENNSEDQEVEIEDKSPSESPIDLGTESFPASNEKPAETVSENPLSEAVPTSINSVEESLLSKPNEALDKNDLGQSNNPNKDVSDSSSHESSVEIEGKTPSIKSSLSEKIEAEQETQQIQQDQENIQHPSSQEIKQDAMSDETPKIPLDSTQEHLGSTVRAIAKESHTGGELPPFSENADATPDTEQITEQIADPVIPILSTTSVNTTSEISEEISLPHPEADKSLDQTSNHSHRSDNEATSTIDETIMESSHNSISDPTLTSQTRTTSEFTESLHTVCTESVPMEEGAPLLTNYSVTFESAKVIRTNEENVEITKEYLVISENTTENSNEEKDASLKTNDKMDSSDESAQASLVANTSAQDKIDHMETDEAITGLNERMVDASSEGANLPSHMLDSEKMEDETSSLQTETQVTVSLLNKEPQTLSPPRMHSSPRGEEEVVSFHSSPAMGQEEISLNVEGKPLRFVAIANLTRPFPLSDFEEQLREYGPLNVFWIDKFRSHCYAQYENTEGAAQCQKMLAGVQFPPETGKKLDVVLLDEEEGKLLLQKEKASSDRFILSFEENKPQLLLYADSRRASVRSASSLYHASGKEQECIKRDLPIIQLDKLFLKTSTKPPLYYKPKKERAVPVSGTATKKRSRENSISDDARSLPSHSDATHDSPFTKKARLA